MRRKKRRWNQIVGLDKEEALRYERPMFARILDRAQKVIEPPEGNSYYDFSKWLLALKKLRWLTLEEIRLILRSTYLLDMPDPHRIVGRTVRVVVCESSLSTYRIEICSLESDNRYIFKIPDDRHWVLQEAMLDKIRVFPEFDFERVKGKFFDDEWLWLPWKLGVKGKDKRRVCRRVIKTFAEVFRLEVVSVHWRPYGLYNLSINELNEFK